jgi:SAM-dependent methyltransferase
MKPTSLTHQHIAAVIVSEAKKFPQERLTVVDAGCGRGALISFLHDALPVFTGIPDCRIHGFDVIDYASKLVFPRDTLDLLRAAHPAEQWADRITATTQSSSWPYEGESADVVVTNQVLEHVTDLRFFMGEVRRVLAPGGYCVSVFPLGNILFEGHLLVPLAGKIRGHDQRAAWLRSLYRLGLGKPVNRSRGAIGAQEGADFLHFATHYRPFKDFAAVSKSVGLRVSYRYTEGLYRQKIRQLLRRPLLREYQTPGAFRSWATFSVLRWLSSITLLFERPEPGSRFADM